MNIKMPENKFLKSTLVFFGTVLVGAVGSGVWDIALRPVSNNIRDLLLNAVSLGVQSFRANVYSAISRGYDQSPTIDLLHFFLYAIIVVISVFLLYLYFRIKEVEEKRNKYLNEFAESLQRLHSGELGEEAPKTPEQLTQEFTESRNRLASLSLMSSWRLFYVALSLGILTTILTVIMAAQVSYVNSAVTHYEKLVKISAPYMAQNEILTINSRFTLIQSREDYIAVTAKLDSIIRYNGIVPPTFSPW